MTVAEAVLGLTAAMLCMFGVGIIELEVMDDGSGRLAQWYENAGFKRVFHVNWLNDKVRKSLWMAAPASAVAEQYAPTSWWKSLVPADFDALTWFTHQVVRLWLERARQGRLPRWSWQVSWPPRAEMNMEVSQIRNSRKNKDCLMLVASLTGACVVLRIPSELVYCRCTIQLQKRELTVLWLGRRDSQGANAAVRGEKIYTTSHPDTSHSNDAPYESKVTCAVALLGAIAFVSLWFGIVTVKMNVLDDGSGRLKHYLKGLGFVDGPTCGLADDDIDRHHWMYAPCELVAQYCPVEWGRRFLTAEDLNRFSTVTLNRDQLIEEDTRKFREACQVELRNVFSKTHTSFDRREREKQDQKAAYYERQDHILQQGSRSKISGAFDKQDQKLVRCMSEGGITRSRPQSAVGRRKGVVLDPLFRREDDTGT
jgi:hypothetical protein